MRKNSRIDQYKIVERQIPRNIPCPILSSPNDPSGFIKKFPYTPPSNEKNTK
jgi:hypothetical protein